MSYNMSIHKVCSSYTSLDTFSIDCFILKDKVEFQKVQALCTDKKNMAGFWKATVLPIRTDCSSLAKDLLLPTLMNGVIKTEKATEICFIFLALLWDALTLPIRLITLLPRICYNTRMKASEHPLMPYLKGKGLDSHKIQGEIIIRVYEKTSYHNRDEEKGMRYKLFLSDREVPFLDDENANQFSSVRLSHKQNSATVVPSPVPVLT